VALFHWKSTGEWELQKRTWTCGYRVPSAGFEPKTMPVQGPENLELTWAAAAIGAAASAAAIGAAASTAAIGAAASAADICAAASTAAIGASGGAAAIGC
jgi:hypothetical protein